MKSERTTGKERTKAQVGKQHKSHKTDPARFYETKLQKLSGKSPTLTVNHLNDGCETCSSKNWQFGWIKDLHEKLISINSRYTFHLILC